MVSVQAFIRGVNGVVAIPADAGTAEARTNDTRRRDLAIDSGAQLISTDEPAPDERFSTYSVQLPPPVEP